MHDATFKWVYKIASMVRQVVLGHCASILEAQPILETQLGGETFPEKLRKNAMQYPHATSTLRPLMIPSPLSGLIRDFLHLISEKLDERPRTGHTKAHERVADIYGVAGNAEFLAEFALSA